MIVDPRGDILAEATDSGVEVISSAIDLDQVDKERLQEPIFDHRRPELYRRLMPITPLGGIEVAPTP
jgi:predicted amidohydrolase